VSEGAGLLARRLASVAATIALAALAGCAVHRGEDESGSVRLQRLLAESDEATLARNPMQALYRSDQRFAAQHGDYVSDAYVAAERAAASEDLARLATIERDALPAAHRIAYDTFRWQRETDLRGLEPRFAAFTFRLRPNHFDAWHLFFAELSSGQGVAPYVSIADYSHGLSRLQGFAVWLRRSQGRLAEGAAEGIVLPRFVVERMIVQFRTLVDYGVEGSPLYGPIRDWPAQLPPRERDRLASAYAEVLREEVLPALVAMRDFLEGEYLPRARATDGLCHLSGGLAWYHHLVAESTTASLTPDEIHAIGLAEIARLREEMDAIRTEVGFAGTLRQFFDHLRNDARFLPASERELIDGYAAIGRKVDAGVQRLFRTRPRASLEIRPTPVYQQRTDAAARYVNGAPDGSRPGVFYVNTFDLSARSSYVWETTYLHEALPGHHFQISLAQENEALPNLLRFGSISAYGEGWALYAETLGAELGIFGDPYQRFGHLTSDMLRSMRLVVDTGLHAKGWTREQAIEYMLSNSSMARTEVVAEVERYIAIPAQALAYKIGQITISRLRTRAAAVLGDGFDVRDFHEQVLMTGAIPMQVLDAKIDVWIAARQSASQVPAGATAPARVPAKSPERQTKPTDGDSMAAGCRR
jgi:uncharacterized protein (DUF885 family)